jgi:hypothetical protein
MHVPNCLDFAFWFLGLTDCEEKVFANKIWQFFTECDEVDAEIIVFGYFEENEFHHIAIFDCDNRNFVIERPGWGCDIRYIETHKAFDPYIDSEKKYMRRTSTIDN